MSLEPESVLVCEGYHDRAFLRSWLLRLGCENFDGAGYQGGTRKISGQGQYALRSAEKKWLRIIPVKGDSKIYGSRKSCDMFDVDGSSMPVGGDAKIDRTEKQRVTLNLDTLIQERQTKPISAIVIFVDDDTEAPSADGQGSQVLPFASDLATGLAVSAENAKRRAQFEGWALKNAATPTGKDGDFELSGGMGSTRLHLVVWRAPESSSPLLPAQQSLERLVCSAVAEVYPKRSQSIQEWLAARPLPPGDEKHHKTHAAAHMAGWFSDRGYEGFFDAVWEDERVCAALKKRMDVIGAGRIARLILG